MLDTILSIVNLIKLLIYYTFYISFKTGQVLVTIISVILYCFASLLNNLLTICVIIVESISIFIQDVGQTFQLIMSTVVNVIEALWGILSQIFTTLAEAIQDFNNGILTTYNLISNGISTAVDDIGQIFVFIKRFIVLLGSGVWFAVTLVPLLCVYAASMGTYYIGRLFQEIKDMVLVKLKNICINIFNFITDVPLESLAGIVIGISLAYIFIEFYLIIFTYLTRQLQQVILLGKDIVTAMFNRIVTTETHPRRQQILPRRTIRQDIIRQEDRIIRQAVGPTARQAAVRGPRHIRSDIENKRKSPDRNFPEDRYCVICQERIKCILLLPCRHVCLCSECSSELRYYNDICPICRTDIESKMKIFV